MAAVDYSKFTDDELEAIAAGKSPGLRASQNQTAPRPQVAQATKSVAEMSDEELEAIASGKTPSASVSPERQANPFPSVPQMVGENLAAIGSRIDSFTGAPARAAIGAAQRGEGLLGAVKAATKQFGADPDTAPTGREIAVTAGVSEEKASFPFRSFDGKPVSIGVSPADVAGFAVDVVADPTNFIPGTTILKGGFKGGVLGIKGSGKGAAVVGKAVTPKAVQKAVGDTTAVLKKFFNPKVAEDFDELVKIAQKAGLRAEDLPEAAEFGPTSLISRSSVARRAGPLGELEAEKWLENLSKVRDAVGGKLREIGGGNVLSRPEAGSLIRQSYDRAVDNVMASIKTSYNKIGDANPGLKLKPNAEAKLESVLSGFEEKANQMLSDKLTNLDQVQAEGILNAINTIRDAGGDYQSLVNRMRNIGKVAFESKYARLDTPPDVKAFGQIYGAVRESLFDTVKSLKGGKNLSEQLAKDNAKISELFRESSIVGRSIADPKMSDEKLFQSLVLADTRKVQALKNILAPEVIQALKASSIQSMIERLADADSFSFARLKSSMRQKQDVLKELFDPDELAGIGEFITLGERFGASPNISAPAAGISGAFKDLVTQVPNEAVNAGLVDGLKNIARGKGTEIGRKAGKIFGPPIDYLKAQDAGDPLLRVFRAPTASDLTSKELQLISAQERERRRKEEKGKK